MACIDDDVFGVVQHSGEIYEWHILMCELVHFFHLLFLHGVSGKNAVHCLHHFNLVGIA